MVDRFDEMMIKPGFSSASSVVFLPIAGNRDDDALPAPIFRFESRRDLIAVHARQTDVQENELGLMFLSESDGRRPVMSNLNLVAEELEYSPHALRRIDVVVDNEYTRDSSGSFRGDDARIRYRIRRFDRDGEADDEFASLVRTFACRRDRAAVKFRERSDDR